MVKKHKSGFDKNHKFEVEILMTFFVQRKEGENVGFFVFFPTRLKKLECKRGIDVLIKVKMSYRKVGLKGTSRGHLV